MIGDLPGKTKKFLVKVTLDSNGNILEYLFVALVCKAKESMVKSEVL